MRRSENFSLRALAARLFTLPVIALAAGLVGLAFLRVPPLGAALFTCGVSLSVALRQFGERAAAIGRAIALPLLTILIVPVPLDHAAGPVVAAALTLAAGAVAVLCAAAASYTGAYLGLTRVTVRERPPRGRPKPEKTLSVPTRMALQMLTALAMAFAIGMLAFPAHWPWIVLSAFIVCSGAVGRGDALYKALLRVCGAIGGTLVAAAFAHVAIPNPAAYAALIFFVLFIGIWLRPVNYAFWAVCTTLLFALLQGAQSQNAAPLFLARTSCILIGAVCGVAATWYVYPLRTTQVVRRRVADALAAMRGVLAGETHDLDHHAAQLERVAAPVRLHRALFRRKNPDEHPATWIEHAHALIVQLSTQDFDRNVVAAKMHTLRSLILRKNHEHEPSRRFSKK